MEDKRNTKEALWTSQKCYQGFLIEYFKLIIQLEFTKAYELLQEEIKRTKEIQIHDFDKEILKRLLNIKINFNVLTVNKYVEYIKKEIDKVTKELSISNE